MRTVVVGVGLVIGLSAAAIAQAAHEQLVLPPFPADPPWAQVTNVEKSGHWQKEFLPVGQSLSNYTDILAAEAYPDQTNTDPGQFLQGIFSRVKTACDSVRVNGPVAREEGGFKVAYAQVYCGHQKGQSFGVNIFYKAVLGADALYVINRDLRIKPQAMGGIQKFSANEVEELKATMQRQGAADKYLTESVYLCGGKSTDARCMAPSSP